MKGIKKLSSVIIALAMCTLLVVTAWAANQMNVSYTAALDDSECCVNELEQKTITLTVEADQEIEMDAFTAQVKVPEGWEVTGIANASLNFTDNNFNLANGMILWYSDTVQENEENDFDVKNKLLATVTIEVPADTSAGEYEIEFEIIDISRNWGMPWEDGTSLTATFTVVDHADGDDANHLCDYCQGEVEGATCTYVPGEYDWNDDYSACTVVGTCACGETATATATVTSVTTDANCVTEEKTTYTATFTESWAENQTMADVVTGEKNPENHTGNNTLEGQKDATATEDGYTGDLVCECGETVQTGTVIGKHQVKTEEVETFTDVPAEVVGEGAKYESVKDMEEAMITGTLTQIQEDRSDVTAKDVTTEFYDVTLNYYDTQSGEWVEADTEHFPTDGKIVVDIPVDDLAHYTYYVAHVFSETAFNCTAGDIEYPEVTEYTDPETGAQYIRFTVTGLSPISVSYVRDDCDWVMDTEKGTNGYTINEDGTHTVHYKCTIAGCTTGTKDVTEDHTYTDGVCICGAVEPVSSITVVDNTKETATYTVDGNVVTVTHSIACKVGYWSEADGKYIAITAVPNENGSYSFTAPEGVTEVLLVVKGDANLDGKIAMADATRARAAYNSKATLTAEQSFAADQDNNGAVNMADATSIRAVFNNKKTLKW